VRCAILELAVLAIDHFIATAQIMENKIKG
jgi:hypothetical protein